MTRKLWILGLVLAATFSARDVSAGRVVLVDEGRGKCVYFVGAKWKTRKDALEGGGKGRRVYGCVRVRGGDFHIRARVTIVKLDGTAAAFQMGGDYFGFDGRGKRIYTNGRLFGGGVRHHADAEKYIASGRPFEFEVIRKGDKSRFLIDGKELLAVRHEGEVFPIGFYPLRATMRIHHFSVEGNVVMQPPPKPAGYTIPTIDLADQKHRQVVVDREKGQYLGHVTTVLLEDKKTMIAVYPKGHGRGAIVMKRSTDGGRTWSKRLPTPKSWATSKEVPTMYRVVDAKGVKRLIMFSGLYPIRMAVSEDDGRNWSELKPIGKYGGIVAMGDLKRTTDGRYLTWFHDDGRFLEAGGKRTGRFQVFQIESKDGGLTWSGPTVIAEHPTAHLCEPGVVRSPDGKQLAMLFRENSRRHNGFAIFSNDQGRTWTKPVELPGALTGDRHTLRYAPDGRIVCVFRDTCRDTPTPGDFCAWIGTYDDIANGREGQYRVRLGDNTKGGDCGYPGLEVLPDGTFVATTYGHWTRGEQPYIMSFRFTLAEIDRLAELQPKMTVVFREGVAHDGYPRVRIPSIVCTTKGTLLAFAEGRQGGDHSENDIILKRGTDGGRTWGKVRTIAEDGRNCLNNPQAVVLPDTGRVLMMYQIFPHDRHGRAIGKHVKLAEPGLTGEGVQRCFLIHSDDDGRTWSKPRDVTAGTKRPDTTESLAGGPGVGIVLRRGKHKGRILMPFNESWHEGHQRKFRVYAAYSDDAGQTWRRGQPAPHSQDSPGQKGWGNEVQLVELADGTVRLNSRSYAGAKLRKTAVSADGGVTWSALEDAPALIEPQCQGTIFRYTDPLDGRKSRILFANPASRTGRTNGTIRLSYDEGKTWPLAKTLYRSGYAYSCLTALPGGTIGCLFERDGYKTITFARFTLGWLTDGKDTFKCK